MEINKFLEGRKYYVSLLASFLLVLFIFFIIKVLFFNSIIKENKQLANDTNKLEKEYTEHNKNKTKLSKNLKSEGCIKLKIGNEKIIGILALASKERAKFTAQQGVELLKFMGSVFERRLSHWLN